MTSIVRRLRCRILTLLIPLAVLAIGNILQAQDIKPGDKVTVIKWDAEFKAGSDVVGTSALGISYEVEKVNGEWLWIASRGGYLKRSDVVPYAQAIDHFTAEISKNRQSNVAYYNRGVTWAARGEHDIAIGDYNESIRRHPSSANYNGRGSAWRAKQEYDKAIADYTEAIRLDPKLGGAYHNRRVAWGNKQEYENVIADYTEAIRLDLRDADTYSHLGRAWCDKQNYDKAIADYTEAIRLDPKHARAHARIARVRATCPEARYRDGGVAIEYATKACELDKWETPYFLDTLAAAYAEAGNFAEAVKRQMQALELLSDADTGSYQSRLDLYKSGKPYREPLPDKK